MISRTKASRRGRIRPIESTKFVPQMSTVGCGNNRREYNYGGAQEGHNDSNNKTSSDDAAFYGVPGGVVFSDDAAFYGVPGGVVIVFFYVVPST